MIYLHYLNRIIKPIVIVAFISAMSGFFLRYYLEMKGLIVNVRLPLAFASNADTTLESSNPLIGMEILKEVKKRESELNEKEKNLKELESNLESVKTDIVRETNELKAIQARIEELITIRDDLEKAAVLKLSKTYAAMPPENAATLISLLDERIAVKILLDTKEKSAAKIMAALPPELASRLSTHMTRKKD